MKYLLYSCLVALFFVSTSCQKDDLITCNEGAGDHRDQLIGTYEGTLDYEDIAQAKTSDEEVLASDKLIHQTVVISKSTNDQELIINGNPLTVLPQSLDNKNEFSDVFIYAVQDCSGRESYSLEFYPAEKRLVLKYEHRRDCETGKLLQKSTFDGLKARL